MRRAVYRTSWCILRALFLVFFRMRATGLEHVPKEGPVLVAANHASFFDPLFVGLSTSRVLHFLARRTLFDNPLFGWLIRLHNAVPIQREGISKDSMRVVLERLSAGEAMLVFPEGTRSADGAVAPFRAGVVRLAQMAGVEVVPCRVVGNHRAFGRGSIVPRPVRVTIHFGAPMSFDPDEDPELASARLRESILGLAPA